MKAKKIYKKLVLNKKTLAHLENSEMKAAKAGGNPWLEGQTKPAELCP